MPSLHPWLASSPDNATASSVREPAPCALPAELLFAASKEPVVIVNAANGIIMHANPAAALLVRMGDCELIGMKFASLFESPSAPTLLAALAEAESVGHSTCRSLRTPCGRNLGAGLSLVRVPPESFVLVRMSEPLSPTLSAHSKARASSVLDAIEAAPLAFVITDSSFKIDYANRAFTTMVGADTQPDVLGNSLLGWLLLTASDVEQLGERLAERRATELVSTVMRPIQGNSRQVEICAVPVPDGADSRWGFTIRMLPRLN
jgi:PAS domain S-box-containing protein